MKIWILIAPLIILSACQYKGSFNSISYLNKSEKLKKEYSVEIDSAIEFTQILLNSYKQRCNELKLNPIFYDSVSLYHPNRVSADYYLSTTRECLIYTFPSSKNKFTINITEFPVQFYLIQNPDYPLNNINLANGTYMNESTFFRIYDSPKPDIPTFENSGDIYFDGGDSGFVTTSDVKLIELINTRSIYLKNIINKTTDIHGNKVSHRFFDKGGVAVLFSSNELSESYIDAIQSGKELAEEEIADLYIKSQYFREIKAYDILAPMALDIENKRERFSKNKDIPYYYPQVKHDIDIMQHTIDSLGIKIASEQILSDAKTRVVSGQLLVYYSTYKEFTFQWIIVNSIWILVLVSLLSIKRLKLFFSTANSVKVFWAATLAIIGWVFKNWPTGLDISFWWFPGLLFLIQFILIEKIRNGIPKFTFEK